MSLSKNFGDLFKSIPDYRKIVSIMFIFKNRVDIINEFDLLKNDSIRLRKGFIKVFFKQNEDYLDFM